MNSLWPERWVSDSTGWWPGCVGTHCPGALTAAWRVWWSSGPWAVTRGEETKSCWFLWGRKDGWRGIFFNISYSFIWLGSRWQHTGSLVAVHGLRSCDTGSLVVARGPGCSQPHHARSVTQSCLTLCNPMDCSLPNSSVCGISQTRIQEWIAISSSRGSSWPRNQAHIPCTTRWFLTTGPPGNVPRGI